MKVQHDMLLILVLIYMRYRHHLLPIVIFVLVYNNFIHKNNRV